jgi:uncharacterized protein (TIGR02996 family)
VREPDHTALAEALQAGKLDEVSEALGVTLDKKSVAALLKLAEEGYSAKPSVPLLLASLFRAAHTAQGFAHEVVAYRRQRTHVLAVRWLDAKQKTQVSIGVSWKRDLKSIGGAWPALKAWARKPAAHADAVAAWAADADQLTITVRPRGEAHRETGDEAALLQAVMDAPDDDAPRLVYADWLLERGDVRGELIRLQCAHARIAKEWSPEARSLKERIDKILKASESSLAGETAAYRPELRRGFVDNVSMTIAAFAKHGERLFSNAPIRRLIVDNPRFSAVDLKKLAATPALRLVRELDLAQSHTSLTRGARLPLAAFAGSPHLERLQILRLSFCGASSEDWTELLENLHAPALEEIRFFYNHTSPAIYSALAANRSLVRLRLINDYAYKQLERSEPAKKMAAALGELAARRPSLESLTLHQFEELDDSAVTPFFAATSKVTLRELDLVGPTIHDATVKRIAASPKSVRLEKLLLHNTAVTLDAIKALLASPHATRLQALGITAFDDTTWPQERIDEYAALLLALPATHPLETVELPATHPPSAALLKGLKRFGIRES